MSRRAHMQTTLPHISQPPRDAGHRFAFAAQALEPCSTPSTSSPRRRPFAWQRAEDDANHRRTWPTHSLLLQPETWRVATNSSDAARLQRRPCGDGLQQSVSIERHLSRIFPAHPRSLARCLSRARRHSAFCFGFAALKGFGFQKIFCAKSAKRFPEPSEKARPRRLGAGHTRVASRRSVPRAIRANPNRRNSNGTLRKQSHAEGLHR